MLLTKIKIKNQQKNKQQQQKKMKKTNKKIIKINSFDNFNKNKNKTLHILMISLLNNLPTDYVINLI